MLPQNLDIPPFFFIGIEANFLQLLDNKIFAVGGFNGVTSKNRDQSKLKLT